ncbi:MAG: restriction endonuclease [Flavobacteriales bacterium]|nr:restriction endonuclease [Flavobacteriales bacterium]
MKRTDPIRVYEFEKLAIGDGGFQKAHFDRLLAWNEANGFKYFTAGHKGIRFNQHVGVIQVGGLVIEVLPKADNQGKEEKWQQALLDMLAIVHDLPLTATTDSHLHKRNSTILDFFFGLYVEDVYGLVRRGLVKQYHQRQSNQRTWKGRLYWPGHLRENLIRKDRFHVVHQTYDQDHLLHALLKRALTIVSDTALDPVIQNRAQDLDWAFDEVDDSRLTKAALPRIRLGRKTASYSRAMRLACMIVQDHAPDLKGGHVPLLGLMFDMNKLFERVVLKLMRRSALAYPDLNVSGQDSRKFWEDKTIRPDIVIRRGNEVLQIIDTKWKVPKKGTPGDDDLKQMYVYNLQFGTAQSTLLYPVTEDASPLSGSYMEWDWMDPHRHGCNMAYIDLFDPLTGKVRLDACTALLTELRTHNITLRSR